MKDDDIDEVVNACDAGREGELIFAYVYETVERRRSRSAAVAQLDDEEGDRATRSSTCAPGEEMEPLEAAARSRSEADWLVGMNATRAASIRLRAAFDGVVSLGRVQTPTLALVARREEEIRAFKPEPYWLVEADFAADAERLYAGRYLGGKRIDEELAAKIVEECRDQRGEITKLEKKEERERSQLLYDLTSLQREANTRFGFSAQRTLGAAQKLYEQHKAITYPRTNSRWLSSDMIPEIRPTAELVGQQRRVREGRGVRHRAEGPAARARGQQQARSRTTTRSSPRKSEHDLVEDGRRTSARSTTSSPSASSRSSIPTPSSSARASRPPSPSTSSAPAGACCSRRAGARSTGRRSTRRGEAEDDSGGDQLLPKLEQGEERRRRAASSRCARRRSRRGGSPRPRCSARWRPRARTSTTSSCARR